MEKTKEEIKNLIDNFNNEKFLIHIMKILKYANELEKK